MEKEGNVGEESKKHKHILFNDLTLYKNKKVVCYLTNGSTVEGKLIQFDEVANCVLKDKNKNLLVLGKSITMICKE